MKPKEQGKGCLISKKGPKASSRVKGKVPAHLEAPRDLLAPPEGIGVFIFFAKTPREGKKITIHMEE